MSGQAWNDDEVARRIAADIPDGAYVNLGIGRPEAVANFIAEGKEVVIHTENGLLGMGPAPAENEIDLELVNAGKKPVTALPGAAFFDAAESFAMIRGGHIDICVLGAFQVSAEGDLANWWTGAADSVPGVGGAMDLALGARAIFVVMTHTARDGTPKLVEDLTFPATSRGVVTRVYTELAVIDVANGTFQLREAVAGLPFEELQARTGAPISR
jgi:3-oxoadipate CoA-transferase beta subunit